MVTSFPVESGFTIPKIALATESVKVLGPVIAKLSKSSLSYKKMNQYLDSTFDLMFAFASREGISGEVAKVAQFCSVQPTAPKATRQRNI